MVRHEAAEALGALGDESCRATLRRWVCDEDAVVRESCVLALDMLQYWAGYKNPEQQACRDSLHLQNVSLAS